MGLIWSQSPWTRPAASPSTIPSPSRWSPRSWRAPPAGQGKFTQRLAAEGVTRQDVREHGLVGTLYLPPGAAPGSHPAVLILNGSGGGINEPRAALYASRGYAAFALAYFKAPGLSDYISNTRWNTSRAACAGCATGPAQARLRRRQRPVAAASWCCCWAPPSPRKCRPWSPTCPAPWSIAARTPATPRSAAKARPGCWAASPCPRLGKQPHRHLGSVRRGPSPHRHEKAILTALQDPDAVAAPASRSRTSRARSCCCPPPTTAPGRPACTRRWCGTS